MNNFIEEGECSISIKKYLNLTLPSRKFTQKKNNLSICCFIPPNFVVAGSRSGTIYRWALPEKYSEANLFPHYEISKHIGLINTMHWSDSMKLLFTGGADRSILVWTMGNRVGPEKPIQSIHNFIETPLEILSYQNYLFVVEQRGISIFEQQSIKETSAFIFKSLGFFKYIKPGITYMSIAFSPNPRVDNSGYLYAGLSNGKIIQYDVHLTDSPVLKLSNLKKRIASISIYKTVFFPRTESLFVFSYDNHIRVYNQRNTRVVNKFKNEFNDLFTSVVSEDDVTHLFSDKNGYVYVVEILETERVIHQRQLSPHCIGLYQGPYKKFFYLQRDSISLIDINRGSVKTSYPIHKGNVFYINMINDSQTTFLGTVGDDKFIRFWDLTDFSMRSEHKCPTHLAILSAYIGYRERYGANLIWAITGHDDGKLFFNNITDHKIAELPSRHKNSISSISIIQNEMKILMYACDYDGFISVWSIDSILENISYSVVSLIKMWKGHDQEILTSNGLWNSNHCVIATGGNDKIIKIWKEIDGSYSDSKLIGHTEPVTALKFEGLFLFSGGEDYTIRIWDSINLVQLAVITHLHKIAIRDIFHLPEENVIASCDASGVVYLYNYIKKLKLWNMKHSSDCKTIYVDKYSSILYACVKGELIPHDLPKESSNSGLPLLTNNKYSSSNRLNYDEDDE